MDLNKLKPKEIQNLGDLYFSLKNPSKAFGMDAEGREFLLTKENTPLEKIHRLTINARQEFPFVILGELPSLKSLSLSYNTGLTFVNASSKRQDLNSVLSSLVQLNELELNIASGSLKGLNKLTQLSKLTLDGFCRTKSIKPLAELTHLTSLTIRRFEKLVDISPLEKLTKLTSLTLDIAFISRLMDISPLGNLTCLKHLQLTGFNEISNANVLTNLRGLTRVKIAHPLRSTSKFDISFLGTLEKLTHLDVGNGNVPEIDLDFIGSLSSLQSLKLELAPATRSTVTDVAPLGSLKKLSHLTLYGSAVTDLSSLSKLPKIMSLNLVGMKYLDHSTLGQLTQLEELSTSASLDLSFLEKLSHLTRLKIWSINQGSNISALGSLKRLTYLSVSDRATLCAEVLSSFSKMTNLVSLEIDAPLESANSLKLLKNLRNLKLESSVLVDISGLSSLADLTTLELSPRLYEVNTNLIDIDALGRLNRLKTLELNKIQNITDVRALANIASLRELTIYDCVKIKDFKDLNHRQGLNVYQFIDGCHQVQTS